MKKHQRNSGTKRMQTFFTILFRHFPDPASSSSKEQRQLQKVFSIMFFNFFELTTQQRCTLQDEVIFSNREIGSLVDNLHDFLRTFDQASKKKQIPAAKPKNDIGSAKSKNNPGKYFSERSDRQIRLSFCFENNKSCTFHEKNEHTVISKYLQNMSTIAKIITFTLLFLRCKQV